MFVIVNICQNITTASDNISNKSTSSNNSTSPISEHKMQSSIIFVNDNMTCDNDMTNNEINDGNHKVIYDEDIMWFDYQALFDKTMSRILNGTNNNKVQCTDFDNNELARNVMLLDGKCDTSLIDNVLSGNVESQYKIMQNCANYLFGEYRIRNGINIDEEQEHIIALNYRYLVGILTLLAGDKFNDIKREYIHLAGGSNPDFLNNANIKNVNLYDAMYLIDINGFE